MYYATCNWQGMSPKEIEVCKKVEDHKNVAPFLETRGRKWELKNGDYSYVYSGKYIVNIAKLHVSITALHN